MCEKLAEVDKRLIDGSDEDTQLLDTVALIMRQLHLRQ
jgi:Replication factor C C-terminal domain